MFDLRVGYFILRKSENFIIGLIIASLIRKKWIRGCHCQQILDDLICNLGEQLPRIAAGLQSSASVVYAASHKNTPLTTIYFSYLIARTGNSLLYICALQRGSWTFVLRTWILITNKYLSEFLASHNLLFTKIDWNS